MFIKTLTIQGFKSYRDQAQIEEFSPKHNVVVGRNGSGKSNFFAAIRFVLSDAYTSMTNEERQSLLHEGVSATTTLSAYVEIVFDNSDQRFPTGNNTVILRRTVGVKKDEYSLDKKSTSKADVMNLLESAGFSKSNPYYIVPQGRITALTNAKDHERLALLKEVAGTKVYEQRRAESLKIMAETDAKRSKIGELLEYIESRLEELEEEKEELKEFQEKDKERRCLEYALYQRELLDVGEALEELEEERKGEVHGANLRREKWNEREKQVQNLEKAISEARHSLEALSLSRQDAQSELTDSVRLRTELQCIIDDLRNAGLRAGNRRETFETELDKVTSQIAEREKALASLLPDWEDQRASEAIEKRKLDADNARLQALYSKAGRVTRFRTKAERDKFLKQEIESIKVHHTSQHEALQFTHAEVEETKRTLVELDQQILDVQKKINDGRHRVTELTEQSARLREQHSGLIEERKDLWREDTKLESLVGRAADEMRTAERQLASMMDKDTGMGLRAVDKIAERHRLTGVYGPLYRLFDVTDHKFNMAVELTAGNSLFHVVVDSDETASKVLEVMLRDKTGRVTFMPINRLKPKNPPLPNNSDAIPILEKLRYDDAHTKAFQQVFGKTCVCKDLTVAAAYVKSHGINTITLDGDKVDRKGALTGGFHDVRRSRIEAIKSVSSWRAKYEEDTQKSKETKTAIVEYDQKITQLTGQMSVFSAQQNQIRESRERLMAEGIQLTKEKERYSSRLKKLEADIQELEAELTTLQTKLTGYEAELKTPLTQGLTAEEDSLIETLGVEVEQRRRALVELGKAKISLESKKNSIEIELNESLRRRREELRSRIDLLAESEGEVSGSADDLEARIKELQTLEVSIASLTKKTQGMEKEADDISTTVQDLMKSLDELQAQQLDDGRNISRQQKITERYLAKRQMLVSRKDECNRSIRDLGVLPEEAFEKYTSEKPDRLVRKLHSVNEGLKKFAHVNKKAFEQYNNFTKQRDQLLERREDLDNSAKSIEELVEVLDQRKDEAIERTFKQVAKNFEEVFEKLVSSGRGRLIIQRRIDQDEDLEEDPGETQGSVDNYTGVSIKVSFNSKVDEGLRIQQLSGGQKSLVALATVFAIQKCDPAPFYLFDEIDANLDAQYRTAVASMIQSLSSTAQFIVTTFRPEMLVTADKFYGVLFNNQKVSSIRPIKREEAMEFVDQEAQAR
ncbi:structural maintenance of chromosome protein 3 [Rhodocollybia butyracea]|uniref:Structural maintenance of chromosomes protein n=1 Tax=Rhodocollybia butyracea TaxID=206335 RepID=A0A9P5U466_9AGAR|nr:structural maintenance of chromosome protein 3 [Rhodocollybia butyracea]